MTEQQALILLSLSTVYNHVWEQNRFDRLTKEAASFLLLNGFNSIFIQCVANGNLEMPSDVLVAAKLHAGMEVKRNERR